MKAPTLALTALLATAAWASVPAQGTAVPGLREQAFKPGGRVSLDLSAGDYLVRGAVHGVAAMSLMLALVAVVSSFRLRQRAHLRRA